MELKDACLTSFVIVLFCFRSCCISSYFPTSFLWIFTLQTLIIISARSIQQTLSDFLFIYLLTYVCMYVFIYEWLPSCTGIFNFFLYCTGLTTCGPLCVMAHNSFWLYACLRKQYLSSGWTDFFWKSMAAFCCKYMSFRFHYS